MIRRKVTINRAEKILKNHKRTYYLTRLITNKKAREDFQLLYAYTRWIDDLSDNKLVDFKEKEPIIMHQLWIIQNADCVDSGDIIRYEELYLVELIKSDKAKFNNVKSLFREIILKFLFDSERQEINRVPNQIELDSYIHQIGRCTFFAAHNYLFPKNNLPTKERSNLGEGIETAHLLRDFYSDLNNGVINISLEDLQNYKLNPNHLYGNDFLDWVKRRTEFAREKMILGIRDLVQLPLYPRILWLLYAMEYYSFLNKLKRNEYDLAVLNRPKSNIKD